MKTKECGDGSVEEVLDVWVCLDLIKSAYEGVTGYSYLQL